jgi:hypothetical protein
MLSNDLIATPMATRAQTRYWGDLCPQIALFLSAIYNYPSLEFLHACIWELGDHAALGASMLTGILPLHAALAYEPHTVNLMVVCLRKESQVWCPKYHPESMFTLRTPCRLESTNTRTPRACFASPACCRSRHSSQVGTVLAMEWTIHLTVALATRRTHRPHVKVSTCSAHIGR